MSNSNPTPSSTAQLPLPSTKVWDPVVRVFHWTIVSGFIVDMFIAEEGKWLHRWVGYTILVAIVVRLIWGFVGSPHARYKDFIPTPKSLFGYIAQLVKGKEPRYIGHNPAGALMMIGLIVMMLTCCITGYMQALDSFWGQEWLQELHQISANSILVLAIIHVLAAIIESIRHKENLILSMITGKKRVAQGTDVDHASAASRR